MQRFGHVIATWQLSVAGPHDFPEHAAPSSGVQHALLVHTCDAGHPAGHCTCCPQLFVTVTPPHLPAHGVALSGVQQLPSGMQTSPALAHPVPPPAPQPTV